jgi:phosphoribosylformylglycinamidine cyclo-ligase
VKSVLALLDTCTVGAIAHITGGGLTENVARVLRPEVDAFIASDAWQRPVIFDWLQQHGGMTETEMLRTFNCGIGMVIAVRENDIARARAVLESHGETVYTIGSIESGSGQVRID